MSAEPDFDQTYRLLGVTPDQGWDAVRHAYRQRVQALHPDKVTGDVGVVRQARHRFEQLNRAYRDLRRYRSIFGDLPPAGLAASSNPEKASRTVSATEPKRGRSIKRAAGVALGLVAAFGWFALDRVDTSGDPFGMGAETEELPLAVSPAALIGLGVTLGDVLDVQGQPDRVEGDVWHYGDSIIVFENGRVVDWEMAIGQPLKTVTDEPGTASPVPPLREFFELGSSKAEVLRIQGEPVSARNQEWDYGVSKVYFEDDRVVGWYNSPIDPLRVRSAYETR